MYVTKGGAEKFKTGAGEIKGTENTFRFDPK